MCQRQHHSEEVKSSFIIKCEKRKVTHFFLYLNWDLSEFSNLYIYIYIYVGNAVLIVEETVIISISMILKRNK